MLREVHYLEQREQEEIPADAAELFSKNETFRRFRANLDLTVTWYNKVRQTVLEVEYPLVEEQLASIDSQLEKAEKDLNWTNDGKPASVFHLVKCKTRDRLMQFVQFKDPQLRFSSLNG